MGKEKQHFILNPNARNSGSMAVWNQLRLELEQLEIPFTLWTTEYPGHATQLTRLILEQDDTSCIIAVGGDGTLFEVINGFVGFPEALLGFVGAGSGNDFCRGASIPIKPEAALALITSEPQQKVSLDCGKFTTDHSGRFASSVGMGVDAVVTETVNKSSLKTTFNRLKLGKLVYLMIFLRSIWTFSKPTIEVEVDDVSKCYKDVWLVNIANNPYFGGGIKVSPEAKMNDGLFHVMVVHSYSKWMLLFMFVSVAWGGHCRLKNVEFITGKKIRLISDRDSVIHADGETIGRGKVEAEILPAALNVICAYH